MAYYHNPNPSNVTTQSNFPTRGPSLQHANSQGYQRNNQFRNGNMGDRQGGQQGQHPALRARYYPGGNDDYQMPLEVVSPLPQRVMPEIPANMQENLANLELGAGRVARSDRSISSGGYSNTTVDRSISSSGYSTTSTADSYAPIQPASRQRLGQQAPEKGGYTASYEHTNAGQYQNINNRNSGQPGAYDGESYIPPRSPRKKSLFPKPPNAGQNVPLSDDEKEAVLERARTKVMTSNDPDMQLAWAQDALQWVEISERDRENDLQGNTAVPPVEDRLRQDALEIVKFLADQGHPKAEFMKGVWMEFGKFGYPIDKKQAFMCYKRSANRDVHGVQASGRAEYRMGWLFESTKEMSKAIQHYQLGVDMGDAASSYRLGMMTLLGEHGQFKDPQRGLDLIRYAADYADENAPQGAYMYGMLLAREISSISVPDAVLAIDIPLAKNYIEKAAYLGFAKAQLKMGNAYELCQLGCEFDPALSLHYNALAAKQGEAESDMAISKWFLCGFEGVFEKNEEQAFVYASRAAQTEMPTAEFAMGYFYEIGIFVPSDMAIAKSWYEKAAAHGNQDAISSVQRISSKKFMSRDDHQKVGLNKIKSLHGSQRGGRPDPNRVRRKPAPMAAMPEVTEAPPSDRQPAPGSAGNGNRLSPNFQSRPPSAAPYPVDDSARMRQQPVSSPHYNPNLGPSRGPDGRLSNGPQGDRPSSAFGSRPLQHSSTAPNNPQNLGPVSQRPSTAMGNMPNHQNGRVQTPLGQRRSSPNQAPVLPAPNLGPQFGNGGNQRPPQGQPMGHPGYPGESPQHPAPYPQQSPPQQQYPGRASGLPNGGGTNIRPARGSSMQPPGPGPQGRGGSTPVPQGQQRPVSAAVNNAPNTASPPAAAAAPIKTGPKTFEEMGVHVQKKESECVVM